jgi:DNA helicase-2/ATP-dependent DNA helicase PcrA
VTVERLRAAARAEAKSMWDAARAAPADIGARAVERVGAFVKIMDDLRAATGKDVVEVCKLVLERSGYWEHLTEQDTPEARARLENLDELVNAAQDFAAAAEDRSLSAFLENTALSSGLDEYDAGPDRVTLMTVHAAKGLEFPAVFIVGLEEGLFPHGRALSGPDADDNLAEERRLCYVGMTRAKKRLYLNWAGSRQVFGQLRSQRPSRFLNELPPGIAAAAQGAPASTPRAPRKARHHLPRAPGTLPDYLGPVVYDLDSDGAATFAAGARVAHELFGIGEVRDVAGKGDEARLTIYFPGVGLKKIIARFIRPA